VSLVFEVDPARIEEAEPAIAEAVDALSRGELVVMPTETVYGIACRPDLEEATERLFAAKRRPRDLALPVLAGSVGAAWEVVVPNDAAVALATAFWPGPLTMVLPRTDRSRSWRLGEQESTVALRVPDHPLSLELLRRAGQLAVTSANISGREPVNTYVELSEAFGDRVAVYLVLAPGVPSPTGSASTVIDLTGARPEILRAGPITREAVDHAVARGGWRPR
jgi:tRNA threonylcarbamoyl adenosine modification protein (Sua5/YciO/YrdC/YwlC family)